VAEVGIRARFEGREFSGKSTSHNVVEAAARAYLQAANKAVYEMKRLAQKDSLSPQSSLYVNEKVARMIPGGY
jgi:hypothetical protein